MIPLEEITTRWTAGETISEIARVTVAGAEREPPVSRQAISTRLIRAGFSPAERRAQAKAMSSDATPYQESRAESVSSRVERRERARRELEALAVELGVSPMRAAETERGREVCRGFSARHIARLV